MTGSAGARDDGDRGEPTGLPAGGPARPVGARQEWAVWRQDESGNRFLVSGPHTRAEAERRCAELERGGHKQMYWVDRRDPQAGSTGG